MALTWKPHSTSPHYEVCEQYPSYIMLVRTKPMPEGYLWQAHKHYGYAATVAEAKTECEEVLYIQIME